MAGHPKYRSFSQTQVITTLALSTASSCPRCKALIRTSPLYANHNWIFVQVVIMMLYVKGFKIDRQKVVEIVESQRSDPLVDVAIRVVVEQLN
jgi:hypothetical protein